MISSFQHTELVSPMTSAPALVPASPGREHGARRIREDAEASVRARGVHRLHEYLAALCPDGIRNLIHVLHRDERCPAWRTSCSGPCCITAPIALSFFS